MFLKRIILICLGLLCLSIVSKAQLVVNPGTYQQICPGTTVVLGKANDSTVYGGVKPYTYVWTPTVSLNDDSIENPKASPTVTTTYSLVVKDATGESKKGTVTIYVYPYYVDAGKNVVIKSGQTIALQAEAPGNIGVSWNPPDDMFNSNTLNPDAFPGTTTQYTISAQFPNGCVLYDDLTITVLPSSDLFFYNSFTPNGDGANDVFYIGNINLYPNNTLQIYNRYGQLIYNETGYKNDWGGSYLGTETPCGTYFYILDTHDKPGKFHGDVTIIR